MLYVAIERRHGPLKLFCHRSLSQTWHTDQTVMKWYRFSTALHYGDVTMGAIASQSTSPTIVYSTVYSDADQRKHQSSASLAFVWGNHRGPVISTHKWPVTRKMFPFDDIIMVSFGFYVLNCFEEMSTYTPLISFLDSVIAWLIKICPCGRYEFVHFTVNTVDSLTMIVSEHQQQRWWPNIPSFALTGWHAKVCKKKIILSLCPVHLSPHVMQGFNMFYEFSIHISVLYNTWNTHPCKYQPDHYDSHIAWMKLKWTTQAFRLI